MMKNTTTALFVSALLLTCSCSLDENLISDASPETYYQTEEQCVAGLNACYNPIRSIYNNWNYFVLSEGQTDLMYINRADQPNAILQVSPSSPQFGSTMWKYGYLGVMRANAAEAGIERSPISEEAKQPLLAEAAVLRALFYYILTSNFGDVPFYEEEVTGASNARITHLPRMSAHDTRNILIDELHYWLIEKKALDFKPTNSPESRQKYRCGAPLGLMLAGKMCLWEERWTDAVEFFGCLEDIYGNGAGNPEGALDRYPLADIPFRYRQTAETILEISNINEDYGMQLNGQVAVFCTPGRSTSATEDDEEIDVEEMMNMSDYYSGIGIPELGSASRTRSPLRPTKRFYQTLMPYTAPLPDRRRAHYTTDGHEIEDGGGYLAWGWVGYAKNDDRSSVQPAFRMFSGVGSAAGRPFLGDKFWCFGMQYTNDSNSYKLFRFAGAILGLAEAWFQKGDMQKACDYLNAVKSRAGTQTVEPADFASDEDLFHEIQDEYARELFGEFQRKHDLVRWGIWYDMVVKYNAGPSSQGGEDNDRLMNNIKPCHEYYPIPDEEIVYSGGALDNKEYNRYGL